MDTTTPLTQFEAGRVRNELWIRHNKKLKYSELYRYTPEQIASRYGFKPRDIAEMAGREGLEPRKEIRS